MGRRGASSQIDIDLLNDNSMAQSNRARALVSGQAARRRYDSPRRRDQARATRAAIAAAARGLFMERGWAGTRVRDVAAAAGVAEPTVYAVYGSKSGLALALIDAVADAADLGAQEAGLAAAAGDPAGQLAAMAGFDRRLFERGGDVLGLLHDAGRSEPDLAAAYRHGRAQADQVRQRILGSWPPHAFREGMNPRLAADTYAALCNIDVYRILAEERGWSPEQIERWWLGSLIRLILR
jgi:TetR/AcrR family transcriptional regulator, regulator of cefoperazone and chloramphenicol sensitivity